ncbi:MAG: YgcG family protein [Betaproteobacteria bacterium]|nr:YgcG family protein [Betaproteobacteria bacterium]
MSRLVTKGLAAILALVAWLVVVPSTRAEVPVPPLEARVTDLTGTLSPGEISALEARLAAFEQRKGSQIFVLLVPTTKPETIEQYAIRVADTWKPGRKGVDDGALLLVAKDDRAVRIDTRYGLEGSLSDIVSNRIIEDIIVPRFRTGDFAGGIDAGVDAMIRIVDGEPLPPPSRTASRRTQGSGNLESLFVIGFVLVVVVGGILRHLFGRVAAASIVGGMAGFAAWMLAGALAVAVIAAVIAFVFTLGGGSSGMPMRGGRRGGWYGGFPGGGGGWSSGGGGFGGGGGGLGGGGGASGRW